MSLKMCALASGSKGNAVYITNGDTHVLIDCGLSVPELRRRLSAAGGSIETLDYILVTHEHTDHIKSAETLSEVYRIPLYAHEKTLAALCRNHRLKNAAYFRTFGGFGEKGLEIVPFRVPHDVFTVGYRIKDYNSCVVYCTDLGYAGPSVLEAAAGADIALIESNYDFNMLQNGRYPAFLKQRIRSEKGHLSNSDCANAVLKLIDSGTKNFLLGHISQENNMPNLALDATLSRLRECGVDAEKDCRVHLALQDEISAVLEASV